MRMNRLLSPEERQGIVELYKSGTAVKCIMEEYACCRNTVYNTVNRALVTNQAYKRRKHAIIYPNIERYMIEHNLSMHDLAKMCGGTHVGIWKNLTGETTPRLNMCRRICDATGMSFEVAFKKGD